MKKLIKRIVLWSLDIKSVDEYATKSEVGSIESDVRYLSYLVIGKENTATENSDVINTTAKSKIVID